VKRLKLTRDRGWKRFWIKLSLGLFFLIVALYFTISMYSSSDAIESGTRSRVQSDLSLVPISNTLLSGLDERPTEHSNSSNVLASPSEMNKVVPLIDQHRDPFDKNQVLEFLTHRVRAGENPWSIANSYGRQVYSIVSSNYERLKDRSHLPRGAEIRVPNRDGILIRVKPGQTLWDLMKTYGVNYQRILQFNEIKASSRVRSGQTLFIPGAKPLNSFKYKLDGQSNGVFSWPVSPENRRLNSTFGMRLHPVLKEKIFHRGVDLGAERGDVAYASRAGEVVFSGRYGNYGQTVIVDHADGYRTLYAHLHRSVVNVGTFVELGEPIGYAGSSGLATGTNLHFEVRKNQKALDPLRFLSDQ